MGLMAFLASLRRFLLFRLVSSLHKLYTGAGLRIGRKVSVFKLLSLIRGSEMNQQYAQMVVNNTAELDMMFYMMGMHCWCGQHTQDLSLYNLYDVGMGN